MNNYYLKRAHEKAGASLAYWYAMASATDAHAEALAAAGKKLPSGGYRLTPEQTAHRRAQRNAERKRYEAERNYREASVTYCNVMFALAAAPAEPQELVKVDADEEVSA